MKEKTRVIVVHGYCMLREGLVDRLKREMWIEVCEVTASVQDVPDLIYKHKPYLVVTNVAPKCSAGMTSLRKLQQEFAWIKILAFSCSSDFEDVHAGMVLSSGADGYVSSADTLADLIAAVRTIKRGETYLSPQTRKYCRRTKISMPGFTTLSRREAEVFCLTGCGYVTAKIAEMLSLKVKTVESYRERIRQKMHLSKGSDLLYTAVSFMRSAARRGAGDEDDLQLVKELLSTTES